MTYTIGRLEFLGNRRLRDNFLVRAFNVEPGSEYSPAAVGKGIARLNRLTQVRPIQESDVVLAFCDRHADVDIRIRVREY